MLINPLRMSFFSFFLQNHIIPEASDFLHPYEMQNNCTLDLLKEEEFWVPLKIGVSFLITECNE
jgi:hypothetical protein